jgi:hypothetical protein
MAVFATALIRTIQTRDARGTPRKVFVYQDVFHDGTPDNPENETRGAESMVVDGGREVSAVDNRRYRIAVSGEILVADGASVG